MLKTVTSVPLHENGALELLYVDALLEAGLRVEQWKSLTTHDLKETLEQSACCCLLPHLHAYIRA